jgi:23S rRNA pseudouridine2605 synthase
MTVRPPENPMSASPEKLQKVLARAGVASRRVVEALIAEGRVSVNGTVAEVGARVDGDVDVIEVDGAVVATRADLVHYLLHKPLGVVTTAKDTHGRPTVVDLVPAEPRVFPVGRLDADTEGLLLLTNDGELAHRLTHPSYGVEKEYLAHVQGEPTRGAVRQLRDGIELEDGRTAPAGANVVAPGLIRLTIHEGRNRQVRRMCEAIGHPVERLVRVRIGPLKDRKLKPGASRPLTTDEVRDLERAVATPGKQRRITRAERRHALYGDPRPEPEQSPGDGRES